MDVQVGSGVTRGEVEHAAPEGVAGGEVDLGKEGCIDLGAQLLGQASHLGHRSRLSDPVSHHDDGVLRLGQQLGGLGHGVAVGADTKVAWR